LMKNLSINLTSPDFEDQVSSSNMSSDYASTKSFATN
jgi:hypothetical protein